MKTFLELILIIIFTFSFNVSSLENGEFSSKVLLENLMIRETTQQDLHSIGSSPALKIPKMIRHQSQNNFPDGWTGDTTLVRSKSVLTKNVILILLQINVEPCPKSCPYCTWGGTTPPLDEIVYHRSAF